MKFASRVENLPPYVFAGMAKKLADLRAAGVEVINFGMGDPDVPTPYFLVEALRNAAEAAENFRYPDYFGKPALKSAIANYYEDRFKVTLDPDSEVLPLIGSKEGIAHASLAFVGAGDVALVPDPSYPVYKYGTLMADGTVAQVPLTQENGWLPDLENIGPNLAAQAKVLWLNYPSNPTGAVAGMDFFERAVAWAHKHEVILAHDNPYAEIGYDGYLPHSILEVPGAKEVAVEFNSFSKTFSMAGYRAGMVVGNAEVISVLSRVKSNVDSGIFGVVQDVAIAALTCDRSWIPARNELYRCRRDAVHGALAVLGIEAELPKAGMYIWAPVPNGYTAKGFADRLLSETGIAVTPGSSYGEQGAGYFRMSLTVPDDQVMAAVERLANFKL